MKSDVARLQLKQTGKVSFAQGALLGVLAVIATKFCTLPSVIAKAAESKAVWSILILTTIELVLLFFSVAAAKCGGLPALPIKKGVRTPLLAFFFLFFALKLTALSREIATYFALSLFENVAVLPLLILLLVACAALARKGFSAIGRMLEIFVWLFLFVLLFVLVFTRSDGDFFNAIGMFSPDLSGIGKGVWQGWAWFGDGAILAFVDLSGDSGSSHAQRATASPERIKAKRKIALTAAGASLLIVVIFYAVFTSVYGDAAKMTDYAFIKLSAFKANADELGSADWPVIILWSVFSCLYLALLFLSGKECAAGLSEKARSEKGNLVVFAVLGITAVLLSTVFLDEDGDYAAFMTRVMNVVTVIATAATVGAGLFALRVDGGMKK